jgi:hypothetical protein
MKKSKNKGIINEESFNELHELIMNYKPSKNKSAEDKITEEKIKMGLKYFKDILKKMGLKNL